MLTLQAELARALAGEIRATITKAESSQLERPRVVVPEAFDLYSRGRYFFNRRMIETDIHATLLKAIAYLEQATQKDGTFAPAYAGLAEAHSLLGYFGYVPPQKAREALQENAEKALALDDTLAEAHNAMAVYRVFEQDWDGAEREYLRAIDLNPNYPVARAWYSFLLIHLGRSEQALEQTRRGLASDPFNTFLLENHTLALLHLGRYDEALAQIQESVELEPRASVFEDFYFTLGGFYRAERRDAEAIYAFEKAGTRRAKAMALNTRGDPAALRALLKEARQQSMEGYVSPLQLAEILTALGDSEAAFSRLEEAYVAREPDLLGLKESPVWEPLRSDPRFADLLRRLKLD